MVRRVCVRTCLLPRLQHLRADTRCLGFLVGLVAIAALVAVFLGYCVTSKGLASLDDVEVGLLQVAATLHSTGFTNQLKRRAVAALRYGPWLPASPALRLTRFSDTFDGTGRMIGKSMR